MYGVSCGTGKTCSFNPRMFLSQGRSTRGGHSGFGRCTFPIIPSSDSRETADGRG